MTASATGGAWMGPLIFQTALSGQLGKTLAILGDSINQGLASATDSYRSFGDVAANILSDSGDVKWSCLNYARASQKTSQTWLWAKQVIPNSGLDYALMCNWSPNDPGPNGNRQNFEYVMAFIALCRKHGVKPIIRNTIPIGGTNTASDANRLADNAALAKLAASGVCILLDANAIVTDGATPQRIRADMNYDGTHMNQAAQNSVGAQLASLLR